MKFNPWHHVSPKTDKEDVVRAVIEIPKGCRAKYELDKESGMLILDRVLYSSVYYPANYGFIPKTYCDDNDPLDILVLCSENVQSMSLVEAKVIGVMGMLDQGEADDKLIAVAEGDPAVRQYNDLDELPQHLLSEMRSFFEDYKKLENKEVKVEAFQGKEAAMKILKDAYALYQENKKELRAKVEG